MSVCSNPSGLKEVFEKFPKWFQEGYRGKGHEVRCGYSDYLRLEQLLFEKPALAGTISTVIDPVSNDVCVVVVLVSVSQPEEATGPSNSTTVEPLHSFLHAMQAVHTHAAGRICSIVAKLSL